MSQQPTVSSNRASFRVTSSMPQGSIPPYLTSGAFSRAHHAFVVKLDQATTPQATDAVINAEVSRVRTELSSSSLPTSKIGQALLILLHCAMIRQDASANLDFALVHAIKLAESGKVLKERRIGYLYLCERLPVGHELTLLFINTIRKDLSSTTPAYILLAMTAITSIPSPDLAPAILPQLTSRTLLRHTLPAIRKAALHCLRVICTNGPSNDVRASSSSSTLTAPSTFSLASDRLGRLLSSERDSGVISAILKCTLIALKRDMTYCAPRSLWISAVLQATGNLPSAVSQVTLDLLAVLELLLRDLPDSPDTRAVGSYVVDQIGAIKSLKGWNGAFVIRACALAANLESQHQTVVDSILGVISLVMRTGRSHQQDAFSPNDHCAVLKCLLLLPRHVVETRLSETEMGVVMSGLDHQDQTIRRQTLRLLSSIDPALSDLTIERRLEKLKNEGRHLDTQLKQAIATRALEVAIVDAERRKDGRIFAQQVNKINAALDGSAHPAVTQDSYQLWEQGMTSALETVKHNDESFGESFTSALVESSTERSHIGQTLSVILASVMCEYTPASGGRTCVQLLLELLRQSPSYVQEPLLIALVATIAREGSATDQTKEDIRSAVAGVRSTSRKPLRTRCDQVLQVLDDDLLGQVCDKRKAGTLIDWLHAMTLVVSAHRKFLPQSPSSANILSPAVRSPGPVPSANSLRYDAYEAPISASRLGRRVDSAQKPFTEETIRMATAGDLALAQNNEHHQHAEQLSDKLNLLDFHPGSPPKKTAASRRQRLASVPDPFGDSDPEE